MTLSYSHYLTVNVPFVHVWPEYRPQLHVSLPPEDDPKFPACSVPSANLTKFDFSEFPRHQLGMNRQTVWNATTYTRSAWRAGNCPASACPPTRKLSIPAPADSDPAMAGNVIMHDVLVSENDQWHVGQEIGLVVSRESLVIRPVITCGLHITIFGSYRKSVYHSTVLERFNSETIHFRTCVDIN
jgi:hypothetical protein